MTEQEQKPEQKPKRKALRVLGQVIRWIIISILAILLVLAIVFQAAWKITFLLVILAAGLSLIPKVHRKWFYLSIAVIVLALIIWVFLPDDNEDWRPYTFDKEIDAFNAKYHIPDEENAALIYDKLIDSLSDQPDIGSENDYEILNRVSQQPWKDEDYPQYSQWLRDNEKLLNELLKATSFNKCFFLRSSRS